MEARIPLDDAAPGIVGIYVVTEGLAAMEPDSIIEEIHAVREALSRAAGHDIRKIAEASKARQAASGRKTVRLPPRKPKAARKAS